MAARLGYRKKALQKKLGCNERKDFVIAVRNVACVRAVANRKSMKNSVIVHGKRQASQTLGSGTSAYNAQNFLKHREQRDSVQIVKNSSQRNLISRIGNGRKNQV